MLSMRSLKDILKESILDDIDTQINKGDNVVKEIDAEFKNIHRALKKIHITNNWDRIKYSGTYLYSYRWNCEGYLKLNKFNEYEYNGILIELQKQKYTDLYTAKIYFIRKDKFGFDFIKKLGVSIASYKNINDFANKFLLKEVFKDEETLTQFIKQNYTGEMNNIMRIK